MRNAFFALTCAAVLAPCWAEAASTNLVRMTPFKTFVAGTNETLAAANAYTDAHFGSFATTNYVGDEIAAHAPGNYETVSNRAMSVRPLAFGVTTLTNAVELHLVTITNVADAATNVYALTLPVKGGRLATTDDVPDMTNIICNVVTNDVGGASPWTTGVAASGASYSVESAAVEWRSGEWKVRLVGTVDGMAFDSWRSTGNSDESATCVTSDVYEVVSERTVEPVRNALGLAYAGDLPTDYLAVSNKAYLAIPMPAGTVTAGLVLTKTTNGVEWVAPSGGAVGALTQIRDADGKWYNIIAQTNAAGQVVTAVEQVESAHEDLSVLEEKARAEARENDIEYAATNEAARAIAAEAAISEQLGEISSLGRFLSTWNSATGKPGTEPKASPLTYLAGDYYIVGAVAASGAANYAPNGGAYTNGTASTAAEAGAVAVNDIYRYSSDGTWIHVAMSAVETDFSQIAGYPTNNTRLAAALDARRLVTDRINWADVTNAPAYVTESVTNGLASEAWVSAKGYVTETVTNGVAPDYATVSNLAATALQAHQSLAFSNDYRRIDAKLNWSDVTNHADFVTETVTNGLASEAWVTAKSYVTETVTNGLASEAWVTAKSYVTETVTNGLASEAWVTAKSYVTETVTNGLASEAWVSAQDYVTETVTNALASEVWVGEQGYLTAHQSLEPATNYANAAIIAATNAPVTRLQNADGGAWQTYDGQYWEADTVDTFAFAYEGVNYRIWPQSGSDGVWSSDDSPVGLRYADGTWYGMVSVGGRLGSLGSVAGAETDTSVTISSVVFSRESTAVSPRVVKQVAYTEALAVTNDYRRVDAKINWSDVTNHADFVTESVTNNLASEAWVWAQGYVTEAVTNGVAPDYATVSNLAATALQAHQSLAFSNDYRRVDAKVNWGDVTNHAAFVTESVTNGVAPNYAAVSNAAMTARADLDAHADEWTGKQDAIADYTTTGAVRSIVTGYGYETAEHSASTYQPVGAYLTAHQSLSFSNDYRRVDAKLNWTDVTNAPAYVTEAVTNGLASEGWVSAKGYLTVADAATTYQPAGDYLTVHQSLAFSNDYRRVDAKINWGDVTNHAAYVTESVTNGLASEAWVEAQGYITSHQSLEPMTNYVAAATNALDARIVAETNRAIRADASLAEQLDGKQPMLPDVVYGRYLHASTVDGSLEWSEVSGGGGGGGVSQEAATNIASQVVSNVVTRGYVEALGIESTPTNIADSAGNSISASRSVVAVVDGWTNETYVLSPSYGYTNRWESGDVGLVCSNGNWTVTGFESGSTITALPVGSGAAATSIVIIQPTLGTVQLVRSSTSSNDKIALASELAVVASSVPTLQQIYDLIYPVGAMHIGFAAPTVPTGVSATWAADTTYNGAALWVDSTQVGTSLAGSLPNISGYFQVASSAPAGLMQSQLSQFERGGPFTAITRSSKSFFNEVSGNLTMVCGVNFNASIANSIYGASAGSSVVRPTSKCVAVYKRTK